MMLCLETPGKHESKWFKEGDQSDGSSDGGNEKNKKWRIFFSIDRKFALDNTETKLDQEQLKRLALVCGYKRMWEEQKAMNIEKEQRPWPTDAVTRNKMRKASKRGGLTIERFAVGVLRVSNADDTGVPDFVRMRCV